MTHQRTRLIRIFALSTAAALAVAACGSSGAAGDKGAANGGAETEFTIELTEFAYKPSDISLPAGETVTLTLKNTGTIPHEFMLGQSVKEDGGYAEDLLAQLDPEVVSGNGYSVEGLEADDSEHAESEGADHAESEGADHAESEGADHA
ncbi:MAG: cupredoxin domain-containing protein, partial [Acidimicrobiia bacterium]